MERYIDERDVYKLVEPNGMARVHCSQIDQLPRADVAPKSEVDRLETEVRLLTENSISAKYPCCVSTSKGLILTKSLEEYDKLLADISSEVAREIFEEIEKIIDNNTYKSYLPNSSLWCREYRSNQIIVEIAELKKKYTEGEND